MQILENWDPLSLPRGSVRALITLSLLAICWTQMLRGQPIRPEVAYLVVLVVGHYFGSRSQDNGGAKGKGPLFLPRGSIRSLIVLGFCGVGYVLWRDGRLRLTKAAFQDQAVTILFLVAALVLGVLVRRTVEMLTGGKATTPRRWFENTKAVVALMALLLLAFASFLGSDENFHSNAALLAAPILGFYFGSRR